MTDTSRVVLVTGGNRGIGAAIAARFADAGHPVAVTHRATPPDDDRVLAVRCDVREPDEVDRAFGEVEDALGPAEIVVSNAGVTRDQLVVRMGDDDFTDVVDANLTGAFRVARRAVRPMMRARFGRLVFVSSVVGLVGQAGQANYAASKAGLTGLARSIARELGSRGVTANVVAPGPVETDMLADLDDAQQEAILGMVPIGRAARVEEVAAAVTYLASDEAAYVTGTVLPVDGGMSMH